MSKLVITDTNGLVSEYELGKERITIGRLAGNDIVLNDKAVSGRHAAIVTILDDSFLEDLESTNGTQVNGQLVNKHPLAHGDLITLGRNNARFVNEAEDDSDLDKTLMLRPGAFNAPPPIRPAPASPPPLPRQAPAPTRAAAPPSGLRAAAAKPLLGKLRVTSGPNQGRELELSKPLTTIGRPGVQVAAITRRAEGYYIVQVGEAAAGAGIRVNEALIGVQTRRLADGDQIELAGTKMQFLLVN